MNIDGFRDYLARDRHAPMSAGSIRSVISRCRRIENLLKIELNESMQNHSKYEQVIENIKSHNFQGNVASDLKNALKNYVDYLNNTK